MAAGVNYFDDERFVSKTPHTQKKTRVFRQLLAHLYKNVLLRPMTRLPHSPTLRKGHCDEFTSSQFLNKGFPSQNLFTFSYRVVTKRLDGIGLIGETFNREYNQNTIQYHVLSIPFWCKCKSYNTKPTLWSSNCHPCWPILIENQDERAPELELSLCGCSIIISRHCSAQCRRCWLMAGRKGEELLRSWRLRWSRRFFEPVFFLPFLIAERTYAVLTTILYRHTYYELQFVVGELFVGDEEVDVEVEENRRRELQ